MFLDFRDVPWIFYLAKIYPENSLSFRFPEIFQVNSVDFWASPRLRDGAAGD
jgi:hypothetical protein